MRDHLSSPRTIFQTPEYMRPGSAKAVGGQGWGAEATQPKLGASHKHHLAITDGKRGYQHCQFCVDSPASLPEKGSEWDAQSAQGRNSRVLEMWQQIDGRLRLLHTRELVLERSCVQWMLNSHQPEQCFLWNTDNSRPQGSWMQKQQPWSEDAIQMQAINGENFRDCKMWESIHASSVTQYHIIHVGGKSKCPEHGKASSAEHTVFSNLWEAILGGKPSQCNEENSSASPHVSFSTS